ncbi:hypothetical protein [Candidatus Reidiella endopervernicosa]|uniref:Uncharacterized protein n=1 Tax=Candidatus Reidiella endopervernicosa TaxID=2738883 RepID=A0A6N0HZN5_9GAMM|nr:hypothetical protein [Candidatus Reidiella endopervernicosa]QKQ27661.1 hypothetical protein HUE57_16195 [Candidatus Reidiella endopervernicosa]
MDSWFSMSLGDAMLVGAALDRLEALFLSEFEKSGAPEAMALFVRHESEGRLHCEVVVYFSPAAFSVAEAVGAAPCGKPVYQGLSLLAGSEGAWAVLFPERGNK